MYENLLRMKEFPLVRSPLFGGFTVNHCEFCLPYNSYNFPGNRDQSLSSPTQQLKFCFEVNMLLKVDTHFSLKPYVSFMCCFTIRSKAHPCVARYSCCNSLTSSGSFSEMVKKEVN